MICAHKSSDAKLDLYPIWDAILNDAGSMIPLVQCVTINTYINGIKNAYTTKGAKVKAMIVGHGRAVKPVPPGGDMRCDDTGTPIKRISYTEATPCVYSAELTSFINGVYANDNTARMTALLWAPCYFAENLFGDSCHTMKVGIGSRTIVSAYREATYHVPHDPRTGRKAHWGCELDVAGPVSFTLP